jgi:hypothetical protein
VSVDCFSRLLRLHGILNPSHCVPRYGRGRMFRQEVRTIGLSIEQGTSSVPNDGRFHVVLDCNVVFSSKAKSAALTHYRRLRDDLLRNAGIEQRTPDPEETKRREREFYDLQAVVSESMRQRTVNAKRKGGKGGSGGVGS